MARVDVVKYSEEEIEILNLVEDLQHFQKLIDISEQEYRILDMEMPYELEQYYNKRQEIYKSLITSLLNLETNTPLITSLLFRLVHKSTTIKKSNTINHNLLKELEAIDYLLAS